jgi:hypothetical protein
MSGHAVVIAFFVVAYLVIRVSVSGHVIPQV